MSRIRKIVGGNIVTPSGIVTNGTLVIEDGVIADIQPFSGVGSAADCDASGLWVMPGMIDVHSDAIEHEMRPRPTSRFPLPFSFYELERKLACQGITMIYHSLSMLGENSDNEARRNQSVKSFVEQIVELRRQHHLIRHKVHLRFEITNLQAVPFIEELMEAGYVELLSFMDHTPGQGQYRDLEIQKKFIMERQKKTEAEVVQLLEERKNRPKVDGAQLRRLAGLAWSQGVPLASHDDDSIAKLDLVTEWNAGISEFPVDMEVALEAKRRGLQVVMGAPNVMLGRSHSNNLSAQEAIHAGAVDILCSDYYPPAMLRAVFLLHHQGLGLPETVNMVSLNPAKALGLDAVTGSIEIGKRADLLLVKEHKQSPVIQKVWVNGQLVCQMDYLTGSGPAAAAEGKGAEYIEA
ncbi:phosphonate metabolism protein PhnM [Paenibacillus piri]|uniref:Phosphonate metabolism protein PhnM n=1 Tax=Paenibacillus piri TaxID=2547395 RepID=A0A4V2ZUF7_9BACL|nr:phosphonate metabolism protein PhnM [Paenibacillus piri]TDG00565.1 phosphonate metabolism protein PhnM [Paenibacillus piri]